MNKTGGKFVVVQMTEEEQQRERQLFFLSGELSEIENVDELFFDKYIYLSNEDFAFLSLIGIRWEDNAV
jgi:hypothetical protein